MCLSMLQKRLYLVIANIETYDRAILPKVEYDRNHHKKFSLTTFFQC